MLAMGVACGRPDAGVDGATPDEPRDAAPASMPAPLGPDPWLLTPRRGAVGLGPASSERALRTQLGDAFVVSARVDDATGRETPGTILFPDDAQRRLEIVWRDTVARAHPALLRVRGNSSRWRLHPGVSLGDQRRDAETRLGRGAVGVKFDADAVGEISVNVDPPPPPPAPPPPVPDSARPDTAPQDTMRPEPPPTDA